MLPRHVLPFVLGIALVGLTPATSVRAQRVPDCVTGCDTIHSEVDVTPHSGNTDYAPSGTNQTVAFVVHNVGAGYDTYNLTMGCTGVDCVSQSKTSVGLPRGTSSTVTVTYTAGAPNTSGSVSLNAQSAGCEDPPEEEEEAGARGAGPAAAGDVFDLTCFSSSGTWAVVVGPYPIVTMVAPVVTSGTRAVVRNRQPIIRATFV